jgi:hypothetical protein
MDNMVRNLNSYVAANISSVVTPVQNVVAKGNTGIYMVFGIFLLALIIVAVYYKKIRRSLDEMMPSNIGSVGPVPDNGQITDGPPRDSAGISESIVEKVLPGKKEVFNVSSNRYAYADAEPLCKALGAELATYDQVKNSWDEGADWCNYGWSKGQLALYPTQESTWKELQNGPDDQKMACGRPGLNGGFFDNPDLRFGVNCYGVKPAQSAHDAREITSADNIPATPAVLEYEKKVNKYRSEADSMGILPFNKDKWA